MLSKPFMTTQEIAKLLKVKERTVRSWIHNQELRAIKLGREFRVAVEDLEAFVDEHATRAPERSRFARQRMAQPPVSGGAGDLPG